MKVTSLGPALSDPLAHLGARVIDLYASAALQGLLAKGGDIQPAELARISFSIAMEMLAERNNVVETICKPLP